MIGYLEVEDEDEPALSRTALPFPLHALLAGDEEGEELPEAGNAGGAARFRGGVTSKNVTKGGGLGITAFRILTGAAMTRMQASSLTKTFWVGDPVFLMR